MKSNLAVMLAMVALTTGKVDEELQARYLTMEPLEFMETFNEQNLTWKMKQYTSLNINVNVILQYSADDYKITDIPVKYNDPFLKLPKQFDAREKWSGCPTISQIYHQHDCGSCWAHGVANVASDRICIHSNKIVVLSEQDLECSHVHQTICHGGIPAEGFKFWRDHGLVTRECKLYNPFDLNRNTCIRACRYSPFLKDYLNNKHHAGSIYKVPEDDYQIRAELFLSGPIQAMMPLFDDFYSKFGTGYSTGIYEHTYGDFVGYHHSVRVIGYGVENGVDYWLVANSWGPEWGEKGLFRIKRFQETSPGLLSIETNLLTGLPK